MNVGMELKGLRVFGTSMRSTTCERRGPDGKSAGFCIQVGNPCVYLKCRYKLLSGWFIIFFFFVNFLSILLVNVVNDFNVEKILPQVNKESN